MIILCGLILGAVIGALRAKKLGGKAIDMLQYGAAHAILFGLIATGITLLWLRN